MGHYGSLLINSRLIRTTEDINPHLLSVFNVGDIKIYTVGDDIAWEEDAES